MTGMSHRGNLAIARKFPGTLTAPHFDVGTAQGELITQVALANPQSRGGRF